MDFITKDENDDSTFIANCEKIIRKYLQLWKPRELFITGVNNIFDSRWATEKEKLFSFWSHGNELRISLFHPNIISSTSIYQDSYRGYYIPCKISDYIKKRKEGEYRLFEVHYSPLKQYYFPAINNGLLVWYSKNSLIDNKGTLMFHYTNGMEIKILHVTLSKSENWNVSDSFGISKSESQEIINNN
jgi:hypothetical protein